MTNTTAGSSYPDRFQVQSLLDEEYGLQATITRITDGEGSFNFRGETDSTPVFVKVYRQDADPYIQQASCRQSELARAHGMPTAPLLFSTSGRPVATRGDLMLSVWGWVEGTTSATVDSHHATAIGETLGSLHTIFRHRFGVAIDAPAVARWRSKSAAGLRTQIIELHAQALAGCGRRECSFDDVAARTLQERLGDLDRLDDLRAGTENLTAHAIHGDYAPPNLILQNHQVAAVVDFGPPEPFLISYELGRIAYFPPFQADRTSWYATALEVIRGYLATCIVSRQDVVMSPRVALIQLLTSLYGVREHFSGHGFFQDKLDAFWLARHHASQMLMQDLPELERALTDLTTTYPFLPDSS